MCNTRNVENVICQSWSALLPCWQIYYLSDHKWDKNNRHQQVFLGTRSHWLLYCSSAAKESTSVRWTFLMKELMFSSHLRSLVMMLPSKQDSKDRLKSHTVMGVGGTGLFLNLRTQSVLECRTPSCSECTRSKLVKATLSDVLTQNVQYLW